MNKAPKHKACGQAHWLSEACPGVGRVTGSDVVASLAPAKLTFGVTKSDVTVTRDVIVTPDVTQELEVLRQRVTALEVVVSNWERGLAGPVKTHAQRQADYRARKRVV